MDICPMASYQKKPPACTPAPLIRTARNSSKYFNISTAYGTSKTFRESFNGFNSFRGFKGFRG